MQNSLHFLFTTANKNRKQAAKPAEDPEQTPVEPQGGYVIPKGAKTYTVEVDVAGYVEVQDKYNVADLVAGADPEARIQIAYLNENGEMAWQDWTVTDGWFGADGAAGWGSQTQMFCLKPKADGTFTYCAAINDGECNAKCTYRYANSATLKAVDVVVTVALTAE